MQRDRSPFATRPRKRNPGIQTRNPGLQTRGFPFRLLPPLLRLPKSGGSETPSKIARRRAREGRAQGWRVKGDGCLDWVRRQGARQHRTRARRGPTPCTVFTRWSGLRVRESRMDEGGEELLLPASPPAYLSSPRRVCTRASQSMSCVRGCPGCLMLTCFPLSTPFPSLHARQATSRRTDLFPPAPASTLQPCRRCAARGPRRNADEAQCGLRIIAMSPNLSAVQSVSSFTGPDLWASSYDRDP